MHAQSTTVGSATTLSLTRPGLALVVGAAVLIGALTGAAVASGVEQSGRSVSIAPPLAAAATFDAVRFRAEERDFAPAPTFDAVRFRAEERDFAPAPTFDAVRFRAEEHAAMSSR